MKQWFQVKKHRMIKWSHLSRYYDILAESIVYIRLCGIYYHSLNSWVKWKEFSKHLPSVFSLWKADYKKHVQVENNFNEFLKICLKWKT